MWVEDVHDTQYSCLEVVNRLHTGNDDGLLSRDMTWS